MADTTGFSPNGSCTEKLNNYIKTKKGVILTAETILNFSVLMCYATSLFYGGYLTLPITELISSILFFIIFSMEWDKMIRGINWVWTDFFRAITGSIVYIIISIMCIAASSWYMQFILAGILGLFAGLLYGYDTFTVFQQFQGTM